MNPKITVSGIVVIVVIPLLFFINTNTDHNITPLIENNSENEPEDNHYQSLISIDQNELRLNHEVIQYKVIFHENDTINVSASLVLQQLGKDFEPQACLLILTNGTASVFKKSNVSFLFYVPSPILFDVTIFGHRIAFGGRLFFKLLNHTRYRIGINRELYDDVQVKKGDAWFLTIANFNSKPGEKLTVDFTSLSSSKSMELVQIDRHTNIDFYSALDNDFEGRYMGFKIPFLPFGFSVANNLYKEVITSRGSVVYFCSAGHAKGRIKVAAPNSKVYLNANNKMASFTYCGNLTGSWNFSASGFGFPWKHMVVLFYADVDPRIKMRNN
jgi:hypothetical protein